MKKLVKLLALFAMLACIEISAATPATKPIATIASFGMALRYSFDMGKEADLLDKAIAGVLAAGLRTGDIMQPGMNKVGTGEMGGAILAELRKLAA